MLQFEHLSTCEISNSVILFLSAKKRSCKCNAQKLEELQLVGSVWLESTKVPTAWPVSATFWFIFLVFQSLLSVVFFINRSNVYFSVPLHVLLKSVLEVIFQFNWPHLNPVRLLNVCYLKHPWITNWRWISTPDSCPEEKYKTILHLQVDTLQRDRNAKEENCTALVFVSTEQPVSQNWSPSGTNICPQTFVALFLFVWLGEGLNKNVGFVKHPGG